MNHSLYLVQKKCSLPFLPAFLWMYLGRLAYVSKFEKILVNLMILQEVGICGFCVRFFGFEIFRFLKVFGFCGFAVFNTGFA